VKGTDAAVRLPAGFAGADPPEAWPRPRSAPRPERLDARADSLHGVGRALARRLAKVGVERVRDLLEPSDRLLIGIDLVKDPEVIEGAYNDSRGVTAEFNRNVLRVVNDGLAGNFEPDAFEHVAFFDPVESWVEMRLRAEGEQRVRLEGAGLELTIADGEEIRTEISAKFTPAQIARELGDAGMKPEAFYTDPEGLFGLSLASPCR
jgi:uncharacterized SAM-dependent methyltransferase